MLLPKDKLLAMAEKYQAKAEKAYQNYQETGIQKYQTAYRNADDLAASLTAAADAVEDKQLLMSLKSEIIWYAHIFELTANNISDEKVKNEINNFVSMAVAFAGYVRRNT